MVANGIITENIKSTRIVKKLKLTGVPLQIYKNTAFIRNMFSSSLEVSKFQNAAIRTVSGIRGQVKKALNEPPGAFRATFEDKILASDIIFLKAWYPVEPKRFYLTVTNLVSNKERKNDWQGMRRIKELRLEKEIAIPFKPDSVYKPIVRVDRKFNTLKTPKKLEQALPFASKSKLEKKRKIKTYESRRAVVMEKNEAKVHTFMQQVKTLDNANDHKRKLKRKADTAKYERKKLKELQVFEEKQKGSRKDFFRAQGQEEAKAERKAAGMFSVKRKSGHKQKANK